MCTRLRHTTAPLVLSTVVLCLAIAPTTVAQQPTHGDYEDTRGVPDTPAGKLITELVEVVNSGDPQRVRKFVQDKFAPPFRDQFPLERHVSIFLELYDRSGGFDLYGIRKHKGKRPENANVAIVHNRLVETWEAFVVYVEPDDPDHIAGLHFAPARPPSDLPPPKKLTQDELLKELRAYLEHLADLDAFSGAVLLAKDGKVLLTYACGPASKRFNAANRLDTKFNLGSMNKMFTGVAVAQLAETGKLAFDDSVSKYLDEEWLPPELADKVTIHHLLTHTSGLGSYFNDEFEKSSRLRFRAIDDYQPLVTDKSLAFEPGESWRYSNTGFLLLGAIIEKVTGQSYFDCVREHVYQPAGMTNTDAYEMDQPVPNLAIGYSKDRTKDGIRWTNNIFKHVVKGGPAGGGFSTVEDLLKFDQALRNHKLLSPKYTELLWTPKPESHAVDYGYGFGIEGTPDDRIVGHAGGFAGISANLGIHLDTGYTVTILSNYDNAAEIVSRKVRTLLARLK